MIKKNIILDLDQTIISSEDYGEYNPKTNPKKDSKFTHYDMEGCYMVFERPGLQSFLDYLFSKYNVSIWTAASKDYATFIIDKIILTKPDRKLDWVFFSYHCDISEEHTGNTKDLSILQDVFNINTFSKDNTIIIDDYDEVYNTQKDNCVIAVPFEYSKRNSHKDKFLYELRDVLDNHFTDKKPAKSINKALQ